MYFDLISGQMCAKGHQQLWRDKVVWKFEDGLHFACLQHSASFVLETSQKRYLGHLLGHLSILQPYFEASVSEKVRLNTYPHCDNYWIDLTSEENQISFILSGLNCEGLMVFLKE